MTNPVSSNTTEPLPFLKGLPIVNIPAMLPVPSKPPTEEELRSFRLPSQQVPSAVERGFQQAGQFFGPLGTHVPKNLAALGSHLAELFIISTWGEALEEKDPEKIAKLQQIIVQEGLDPQKVGLFAADKEKLSRARRELAAFEIGAVSAGVAGLATRSLLATIPRAAVEGATFGAVEGALTPLEEGENRAGRVTSGTIAVGLIGGAFGTGAVGLRMALRQNLTKRGIKPEMETPEVAPMTPAFNPFVDARAPVIRELRAPITDPRRLLPVKTTAPGEFTISAQEAGISAINQSIADVARRRQPPPTPERVVTIPPEKPLPAGAPETLGGGAAQPPTQRGMLSELIAMGDEAGAPFSALKELTRRLGEELQPSKAVVRAEPTQVKARAGVTPPVEPPPPSRGRRTGAPPPPREPPKPEVTYSDAVDIADSKISRGEKRAKRRLTLDEIYTHVFDDIHPINKTVKDLLKLRDSAAAQKATGKALVKIGTEVVKAEAVPARLPAAGNIDLPALGKRKMSAGDRLPGLQDPYVLADLARASIEQSLEMIENGPRSFVGLKRVGPGLRSMIAAANKLGLKREADAFLLAPRSLDFAARGLKPPLKPEVAKAIIKGAPDEVVVIAEQYFKYRDQILQYLKDAGGMSDAAHAALTNATRKFVSFERFFEDIAESTAPGVARPKVSRRLNLFRFKKAKGGEAAKIIDPWETAISNTVTMVTAANRQAILESLVKLSENVPGQTLVRKVGETKPRGEKAKLVDDIANEFKENGIDITPDVAEEIALHLQPSIAGDGRFFLWRNDAQGNPVKVIYEVDKPLFDALMQIEPVQANMVLSLMASFQSVFRAGVILDPSFALIRNPARDLPTSAVYSRAGFKPWDFARGLLSVIKKDELYNQYRASMGPTSITRILTKERKAAQRTLTEVINENHPLKEFFVLSKNPRNYLDMLRMLTDGFEAAARTIENVKVLEATGDPRLAGFASRNLSINFQRMGASIRLLNNSFSPFLGATLQGVEKIPREMIRNPAGIALRLATYITLPTIALWLINFDDPDYQNLPQYIKDNYWLIPNWKVTMREVPFENGTITVPNIERTGEFYRLPKPFEIGLLFGTSVERVLQWVSETDPDFKRWMESENVPAGDPFQDYLSNLLEQMVPGNLPPWLAPFLESASGYDFFSERDMVPESERRLLEELQAGPRQGETTRLIGRYLNMSPRNVDNIVSKTTGGLGRSVLATADRVLSLFGVEGPEESRSPSTIIPLIGPMLQTVRQREPTLNSKPVERFYRAYIDVQATVFTVRELSKRGRFEEAGVLAQNAMPEMLYSATMSAAHERMNMLRQQIRMINRDQTVSREEKDALTRPLGILYRDLAAQVVIGYNRLKSELELGIVDETRQPTQEGGTLQQVVPQGF